MSKLFRSVFKIMIGAGLFMAGWYVRGFFADDSEYDFDDDWWDGGSRDQYGDSDGSFAKDGDDSCEECEDDWFDDEIEPDGRDENEDSDAKCKKCHNCANCTCGHGKDTDE